MLADLDLLLTTVFCIADDLLPACKNNARRSLTDAEVVTLLVAQSIMGIPSDRRFLKRARKQLVDLFPGLVWPVGAAQAPRPAGRRDRARHGRAGP